jgi:DNA polymerase I-like protein with 3'-5' exonuclease and polymerase domains
MDKAFLDCYVGKDVEHVISQTVKDALGDWYPEFIKTSTRDVHTMTAAASPEWQVSYEEMEAALKSDDKELAAKADKARQQAKPTNFLGSYGGGPTKLARKLIVPVEEAKRILETKKELYHGFETWREDMIRYAHEHGFVKNVFGSIRHAYTGLTHYDSGFVKSVERSLINYLIQGCCADNLKRVLRICVDRELFKKHDAVMYAPIYDEIAGSVSREHASGLIMELHSIMTQDIPGLPVPMLAEPSIGLNFADQIEIGPFPTCEKIQAAIEKCFA